MNVPYQIKLHVNVVVALNTRLIELQATHDKRRTIVTNKITKVGGSSPEKARAELRAVEREGRLITINNLIRLCVQHGIKFIQRTPDEEILKLLNVDGLTKGRPARAA